MRFLLPLLLLVPALLPLPVPPAASPRSAVPLPAQVQRPPRAEELFQEARTLLDAGQADEAAAKALSGLAFAPYDVRGYRLMAESAGVRGDLADRLRWTKWLYWSQAYTGSVADAEATAAVLDSLAPEWKLDEPVVAAWADSTLTAARDAVREKRFRVAGHLYSKVLDLRQNDAKLASEFHKLVSKAGEQVSGGAFTAASVLRRSPSWIRKQNERHSTWDKRFERNTQHFSVQTTISYQFFETVSVVMEEMFDFYQDIYDFHRKAPRMTLALHRSRVDFERYNHEELGYSLPLEVRGWFYYKDLLVSAFIDQEIYEMTEADLFNTLFHECSHYFMRLLCEQAGVVPGWLNEGTASFFEGCELKADGSIVKNKPALSRVREWERRESGSGRLSLKELVSYHRPGSYPGNYYAYGWSFVYFLLNYEENDARLSGAQPAPGPDGMPVLPVGPLVYRNAYLDYMKSYTKKQPKDGESSYDRAERLFVKEIDDPAVPDWDAFEDRWRRFTQAIVRETKAGPAFADTLQARCRGYLAAGDFERALIAAEQADDKRPDDAETYRLLALAHEGAEKRADALFWMLRHWEQCLESGLDAEARAAEEWLLARDAKGLIVGYCTPTRQALTAMLEIMDQATQAGHPYLAQLFAAHFSRASGMEPGAMSARAVELQQESGRDLRLWQRAFPEGSIPESKGRVSQQEDASLLIFAPKNQIQPTVWVEQPNLRWLVPPYDIRGAIQIDGKDSAQIMLGRPSNLMAQKVIELRNGAVVDLIDVEVRFDDQEQSGIRGWSWNVARRQTIKPADFFHFMAEVKEGREGRFSIGEDARVEFLEDWTAAKLTGGLGFSVGDDTAALFKDIEVRPREAFWPVPPPADDAVE